MMVTKIQALYAPLFHTDDAWFSPSANSNQTVSAQ